jgi:hypothetical protein
MNKIPRGRVRASDNDLMMYPMFRDAYVKQVTTYKFTHLIPSTIELAVLAWNRLSANTQYAIVCGIRDSVNEELNALISNIQEMKDDVRRTTCPMCDGNHSG